MTKFAVGDIVVDHYATFTDANTGRVRLADYLAMVAAPAVLGLAVWRRGAHLDGVPELLAGVGVLTGGLFALLLQVFPLAERLTTDPRLSGQLRLRQLVDELEANASYAVLVGLVVTGLLAGIAAFTSDDEEVSAVMSGLALGLLGHWLLTSLMTVKRIRAVYRGLR